MNKRTIGSEYEEKAAEFLKDQGYQIVDRNYRYRGGEIDIIAKEDEYYVFVEVKYRSNAKYGMPQEAVDLKKQYKIVETARHYIFEHGMSEYTPCRFDVVVLLGQQIELIRNAFES